MFAPAHHQATRFVVPVRKELAVRTIFNFLGPLTNPAGAHAPAHRRLRSGAILETIAGALARLGASSALVVSCDDGLDELSIVGADEGGRGRRRRASTATRSSPDDVGLDGRRPTP